jgi:HEAT repeat protein
VTSARAIRGALERDELAPADAIAPLGELAHTAPTRALRLAACDALGDLAGRAFEADWDTAERAAFALLEVARLADGSGDRRDVITAMGRGFRNAWLLPYVHRRLSDDDPAVVIAALGAAGGLGFPALEAAVAGFVDDAAPPALRRAAIAALGRMGAMTAVEPVVARIAADPDEAAAALAALTEIRTPAGRDAALGVLADDLEPELQVAAVRYLAELGDAAVLPTLRRLARHHDAEVRLAANLASRALAAERHRDATTRFLVALAEPDRAVRAVLARRLRTLPVAEVLEQADVVFADDPGGVVQVLGELRDPEATRWLLAVARRAELPALVRARAVGAIEANLAWERDAIAAIAADAAVDDAVRAAAIHALGAFVAATELLALAGAAARAGSPALRSALLWALQLAVRPDLGAAATADQAVAATVGALLDDADPVVVRRAAYVAGNLELVALAPTLVALTAKPRPPELRLAAHVALAELADPAVLAGVVDATLAEADPRTLTAASRAIAAVATAAPAAQLRRLAGKATALLDHADWRAREAGARLAGIAGAPAAALVARLADPAPAARAAAATALGRLRGPDAEAALLGALDDVDPALAERAAHGLVAAGSIKAAARLVAFASGDADPAVRAAIAGALVLPAGDDPAVRGALDAAIARLSADDPAFEPLLRHKTTAALAAAAPGQAPLDVDGAITAVFPSYAHMVSLRGFETLIKSMRTAESLYQTTTRLTDADQSPAIVLWMKVLENYVHAWLGGRMAGLQREPVPLFDYVDRIATAAWPGYQRWLEGRWRDPVDVGGARVEIPVRSITNAIRELQEHRRKRLDSPLSVTEWARLIVLFAVDHPSGIRNLFRLKGSSPEDTVRLAHRLHTLAAVRNVVTHRAAAGADTAHAFRADFYAAFETLVHLT